MIFRKASKNDIYDIEKLIEFSRTSLKNDGVDQWQKTNPNLDLINRQIDEDCAYVLDLDGRAFAYAYLSKNEEPTYKVWEDKFEGDKYFVIHTLMVDGGGVVKKAGSKFMEAIIDFSKKNQKDSLRIDTHKDNFRMRGLLKKYNFKEIGIIQIDEDGLPKDRICYELILWEI